ncbi:hypothetical protein RQ831_14655 [Roseomonas gilardii]|uniref:HNH endonuclease n=1 Tax=Roseomonas gilardii TaxID=257708 RepID=A0ABU3MH42_9PROT|nr:hypothetical protein [Roseomonas gilardii]MDT8332299.1 hypothetical protein [Roseomonas gilardii]
MEVEHFYYKEMYPNLVVEWNNLLACCKRCNTAKGRHDVGIEPIVNPTTDDPRVHLSLRNYRFYPKTQIGKTTRDVLNLNDQQRAVQARFAVGELMANYSEELEEIAVKYTNNPTSRLRNKTSNKLEGALKEAAPEAQFGSTAATELKSNVNFSNAISILRSTDVWTPEIEKSYQCCIAISY